MHAYIVVDAFARAPLRGNPVAVLLDCGDLSAGLMQRVARELNLSETVFVLPAREGADARVRIFTPVCELPFAGHPLLGAAIALAPRATGGLLRLETAMGTVPVVLERRPGGTVAVAARMRQPVPTWQPFDRTAELLDALGLSAGELSGPPVEVYRNGPRHVLVGMPDRAALSRVDPDQRALAAFEDLAVNCFAGSGGHWRNRMFSPAYGVAEDPATGSAAGALAVHLARHGRIPYGRLVTIVQGVELGRPSLMRARANGAAGAVTSVEVGGHGVALAHGRIHV